MKKKLLLSTVCLFISIITFAQDVTKKTIIIPEGTIVKVKSLAPITSKRSTEGDVVDFAMFQDLEIDGILIIKEGALVSAFIQSAEKAKGLGKAGEIRIQFNYTKSVNGTKIPLRSTKGTLEGDGKLGGAIALAVVLSPLFLLKKGKEAKIAEGKVMEAFVSQDVKLEL